MITLKSGPGKAVVTYTSFHEGTYVYFKLDSVLAGAGCVVMYVQGRKVGKWCSILAYSCIIMRWMLLPAGACVPHRGPHSQMMAACCVARVLRRYQL